MTTCGNGHPKQNPIPFSNLNLYSTPIPNLLQYYPNSNPNPDPNSYPNRMHNTTCYAGHSFKMDVNRKVGD